MKHLFFSFVAIGLFLTVGCSSERFEGSGNVITDDRTTSAFSAIEVDDAFEVTIRQGTEHLVLVSSDDNILSRISTSITNGVLRVVLSNGNYQSVTLRVEITAPTLDRVQLSDAVSGQLIDFVSTNELSIILNDATKLDMSGSSPNLELDVNDASEIHGFNFTTGTCTIAVTDASEVDLTVTDRLQGRLSDASVFRFRGNPVQDVDVSDASRIIDAN